MKSPHLPLHQILEHIPILISFHDLDYNILWANRAYRNFAGFPAESVLGKKCYMSWVLGSPCRGCPVGHVIESGCPAEMELPSPGQEHWSCTRGSWILNIFPSRDEMGNITGVIETAVEVTDEKKARTAFRDIETLLRRAQHLAHIGHWEMNHKINKLSWSDEIFSIFEIDPYGFTVTYEAFLNAVHPEDRERVHRVYSESLESGTPYSIEHRLYFPDGRVKYLHERCRHYYDDKGKPVRSLGTVQDISENKLIEIENKKLQEKIIHSQKMESVGRLAGGVAHDFNNMLCVILGNLDLALEEIDRELPLHSTLLEARNAAERSAGLTHQLLAFARQQSVVPRVLDLNSVISNMLKMLSRLIGEDIELAWVPGPDLGKVRLDPAQMDQILANLCVNARDAITGTGKITIETRNVYFDDEDCSENPGLHPGSYILLAVSDDGCGMEEQVVSRIFDPFFTTKEEEKGTGLGLATTYGIVKQNNGFINVYSEPGKGTTFRIYLSQYEGNEEEIQEDDQGISLPGGAETILIVEDEKMILNFCSRMLIKFGYKVLTAGTPAEALSLAEKYSTTIDLLITDVVLAKLNGRDLALQLETVIPGLKILYMSGYTSTVIARHGLLDKGITFLQKPFSAKELALGVRKALSANE